MSALWTHTELDIIETLTRRVSLLAHSQVVSIWWPDCGTYSAIHHVLSRLNAAGLCEQGTISAHPRLALRSPLVAWQPDKAAPDFARAAQRARRRWNRPVEPVEVIWASRRAANLFGSTARGLAKPLHHNHDLLLAEVYVRYRQNHPALARQWIAEHVFPKAGFRIKDPDAFLFGADGRPVRAIESAGRYSRHQVEAFHQHCVEHDLPYELW
jgi:hypothetical protein